MVECLPARQETHVQSLGQENPLEKAWQPTPVFLPGECHGQRSLVGCGTQGRKELVMTAVTSAKISANNKAIQQQIY